MSNDYSSYEIIQKAKTADPDTYRKHVDGFVDNFVRKEFRDRWREFLFKRPKQVFSKSSKLHNHLDWDICTRIKDEETFMQRKKEGIFFDFYYEPKILSAQEALSLGYGNDALFFIEAGKEIVFFFHECETYLCKK